MTEMRLMIAGFGGQGILFAGKVVAHAGLIGGLEVTWLPSYGPEMRGGTANCGVCLSASPIGSPLVTAPDALIVMNRPSYEKFIRNVAPGGHVLVDSSLVDTGTERRDVLIHPIPATRLAEAEGLSGFANIVMVGHLWKHTGFVPRETLVAALRQCVGGKVTLMEPNLKALGMGEGYEGNTEAFS